MDAKRKSMLIDEAEKKYAELIKELEFIKKSDSEYFDVKGPDKLCMFRPENVQWAKDNVFSITIEGNYYPNSDISIGNFDTYKEAKAIADAISVQDDELYECYIYKYDEQGNIIKDWRIF